MTVENNIINKYNKTEWKNRKNSSFCENKNDLVIQGKCLCGQYIRARLRRAGVLNRKVIQRLRSILEPSCSIVYEVFPVLNGLGLELERMHPRLYTNVSRQLSRTPFGELEDCDTAPMLLNLVAKELFKNNITWSKITSMFAIAGGFAIDCVRQGHPDFLKYLIDGITEIIEEDLIVFLIDNGGWLGMTEMQKAPYNSLNKQFSLLGWLTIFVGLNVIIYLLMNLIKSIGCRMQSILFPTF